MHRYSLVLALLLALTAGNAVGQPAPTTNPEATSARLAYVMVFVADMNRSVAFYRDQIGLTRRFASPEWSEFETGATILALHPAGPHNKAGTSEVGITVQDLNAFYEARKAAGVQFSGPPKPQSYGSPLTEVRDPDGALISVGGR